MTDQFQRLKLGLSDKQFENIQNSRVAVVGIGGVGSFSAESLARTGVGKIILVDKDVVDITNLNRQIHALHSTIGMRKTEVMKKRINDINPNCEVIILDMFLNEETYPHLFDHKIDFLIDASDTITFKITLIRECLKKNINFISSMGTANKLDPTKFEISDITKTSYDPIAKILRKKLKELNITGKIPVVYSKEIPIKQTTNVNENSDIRKVKAPPSSNAFTPSVAGLICTSYAVKTLISE